MKTIKVIGAGLAGCEASIKLAELGFEVELYDMKPSKKSPAHELTLPAEIVCSNSLGAEEVTTGSGLFKYELDKLGCRLLEIARKSRVKAGRALAVDRAIFSENVKKLLEEKGVKLIEKEIIEFPIEGPVIYATGPLTSEGLAENMREFFSNEKFYFYDAIAPVIDKDSIDMNIAFIGGRYQEDAGDYINCPFTEEQYNVFYNELINAEQHELKDFEKGHFFESCMPIEEIASRGPKTPLFGPMRPVGFEHYIDFIPYAVLQLRQDDMIGSCYNMVGFQTNLKYSEQKRVFSLIPGLENAKFVRYGQMHKNIYVNSPEKLNSDFSVKGLEDVYLAGQITGVEGYVESIFTGLYVAYKFASKYGKFKDFKIPIDTISGGIIRYITEYSGKNFQPMNANFGLLPNPGKIRDKKLKKKIMADKSIELFDNFIKNFY
ncbi:MAG: methylenetetrahydrofolate--tRNA-(uracil(54)-C(5))-methyltransferase (FADH(2)-oxidizing) TrmFO [Candidatus Muirbacterium halophilum]|nr:methylenetetrahydrofolate--tRNA-(uracil(54)-C(5))-methyltransferase (FADH(2)-oxidizing) TrmFO [Candidatus Muirbacterium halophilum]